MTIRPYLLNGSLAFASIALFFIGGEIFLRVTGLQTVTPHPPQIYRQNPDPAISYELRPNLKREPAFKAHVSTDAMGFRLNGTEQHAESNSPYATLAVLGDSIAFGYGVEDEESLPAQLEKFITGYRALNTAVPGYSLAQETALYKEKVAALKPPAVMVVFFWNDLDGFAPGKLDDIGVLRDPNWIPGSEQCLPIEEGMLGYLPGRCWLDLHSAFYKAVKKIVTSRTGQRKLSEDRQEAKTNDFVDPATPEKLDRYAKDLHAFRTALPLNTKKIFVIWPDRYVHRKGTPALTKIAKDEGFAVVNLYERFGNDVPTLPWDTVHPSPQTIEQAAEFIAGKIGKKL